MPSKKNAKPEKQAKKEDSDSRPKIEFQARSQEDKKRIKQVILAWANEAGRREKDLAPLIAEIVEAAIRAAENKVPIHEFMTRDK